METREERRPLRLFVVCSSRENYYELLRGLRVDGRLVQVEQAPWQDVSVSSYPDQCVVRIRPQRFSPLPGQEQARSFTPDAVLLRSFVVGSPQHDHRAVMNAFMHAGIPCINSLESFAWSVDKELLYGRLRAVRRACPSFPLIAMTYYTDPSAATFVDAFPVVVKLGSASQGVGKARVMDQGQWNDTLSLLGMVETGFTSEPMIDWVGDVRIQKIGPHVRAIRRFKTATAATASVWKANEGIGIAEEDVEERWRVWAEACARELDMELLGLDLLQASDGREYVLEVNSSSIGLTPRHQQEDLQHIVEVVCARLAGVSAALRALEDGNALRTVVRARLDKLRPATTHDQTADVARALLQQAASPADADWLRLLRARSRVVDATQELQKKLVLLWVLVARMSAPPLPAKLEYALHDVEQRLGLAEVVSRYAAGEAANLLEMMVELGVLQAKKEGV